MQPLLIWFTHLPKTKGDFWAFGKRLATLILFFGVVFLLIWLYGSSIASWQPLTSAIDELLAVFLDYLTILAAAATVFMMVTILHVFFKCPFLQPCVVESAANRTSQKAGSEQRPDSPEVNTHTGGYHDDVIFSYGGDTVDLDSNPIAQYYDVAHADDDSPNLATDDDTMAPGVEIEEMVKSWASLESSLCPEDQDVLSSQARPLTSGLATLSITDVDLPGAGEPDQASLICKKDTATQTDDLPKPVTASVATMTSNPQLADASVACQNTYKQVKSSNTTTSGPFMKKLRRAQRLLKEARAKLNNERHAKLVTWTEVLGRYKDRLQCLTQSLEKKDVLLSYTALNKALSENEVKDMCTAVSSARDRLLTQCKLNSALKDVVVSKCDSVTSSNTPTPPTHTHPHHPHTPTPPRVSASPNHVSAV